MLDIHARQQLQPKVCLVWSWSPMWLAGTARSPALHCWNPLTQPFVARQLLPHPSGVVDTPQASACSRSRRASISERRGSVPCISPCCERLQTTAATLKARGCTASPPLRAPSSGSRSSRTGARSRARSIVGTSIIGPPPVAGPRPPQSRVGGCRSRRPQVPTPIPAPCPPVILGAFLRRKEGGYFFLESPSRPMSRPVEIHDRRLGRTGPGSTDAMDVAELVDMRSGEECRSNSRSSFMGTNRLLGICLFFFLFFSGEDGRWHRG